jgi:large subunit ribosomal protein L25
METVDLACEKREILSKGGTRALRRNGRIPAIVYGAKTTPIPVAMDRVELKTGVLSTTRQRLIRLKSSAAELNDKHVIFKALQHAPVSGEIIHADLYQVDLQKPLRVSVPLRFIGRAVGVADGGILQPLVRQVEVECLPLEIPEFVEADVSALGIRDVIHVSTLKFAGNVKPIFDSDYAVVSVLPPTVAEVPTAPAAVPAEGAPPEGAAPEAAEAGAAAPRAPAGTGGKEAAGAPAAAGAKKA